MDGEPKDGSFVPPIFSVFEDRYINGLNLDFSYNRGSLPYSEADDDNNEERGYFKVGDIVVIKFASIDLAEYQFWQSYANNITSQGDMFSNPAIVKSNIEGGLGVWVGYGTRIDTVICQ